MKTNPNYHGVYLRLDLPNHKKQNGPKTCLNVSEQHKNITQMFENLYEACKYHTHAHTHQDITIKTCWDSDRLDLGRVGIMPNPKYLCTDIAKTPSCIEYAYKRSVEEAYPEWISVIEMASSFKWLPNLPYVHRRRLRFQISALHCQP